ncbi:MetQ/NlpA family ABC transporter substrate-binding protein [Patulibacter sp.]|uniref:MetQ/NlpA family ABC transporter substrate-binding protein n=1 Tax=Patulibacter sp. TaxID=1912859 RepID=UPI00272765AE|nr:MetQ/NlpA family ABC transporter substrate-binding protein [Patulibacter sp.]MDO9408972.1 MetQ/NlpA family ABC transporter substrate-binding protein [Patulibacter sp.]
MPVRIRAILALLATVVLGLGLTACGSDDDSSASSGSSTTASSEPLKVGASPVPHAEILDYVSKNLAPKAGLKLEVKTYDDYIQPNVALQEGQLDANYFQTVPYLDAQKKDNPDYADLVALKPVHLEPLGIYSKDIKDIAAVPNGASVTLSNDPANEARGLKLLQQAKLITLKADAPDNATPRDIEDNPKDLKFTTIAPANLPRTLDDTDLSVINGNYAIEAKLTPATDALVLEDAANNPNANLLVVKKDEETDPRVVKLEELLHSPEVKTFIQDRYKGSVIPSF